MDDRNRSLSARSDENMARQLRKHYPTIAAQDSRPRHIKIKLRKRIGHEIVSLYTALQHHGVPTGDAAWLENVRDGVVSWWEAVWKAAPVGTKRVRL